MCVLCCLIAMGLPCDHLMYHSRCSQVLCIQHRNDSSISNSTANSSPPDTVHPGKQRVAIRRLHRYHTRGRLRAFWLWAPATHEEDWIDFLAPALGLAPRPGCHSHLGTKQQTVTQASTCVDQLYSILILKE